MTIIHIRAMKVFNVSFRIPLFYCFLFLFCRKVKQMVDSCIYVTKCYDSVSLETIESSYDFQVFVNQTLKSFVDPPAVFMLNQHALSMTFNFLCNTELMNVHERFIFVTLDQEARDSLKKNWPSIIQFYWPNECLKKPFGFSEPAYQVIYLFRASLAQAFIRAGMKFWLMQQDTFWRKNIFEAKLEQNGDYDILFDQIGYDDNGVRAGITNGANLFVRPTWASDELFEDVAQSLRYLYVPDIAIMIRNCFLADTELPGELKCSFTPHSWEWLYSDFSDTPWLIQLDFEKEGKKKLDKMQEMGLYFISSDGRSCNRSQVAVAQRSMVTHELKNKMTSNSWARINFRIILKISELLFRWPIVADLLFKPYSMLLGYFVI